MSAFDFSRAPSQKGRIAIVTGANIGLGYETALALAKKECTVIMACRNREKANKAKAEILAKVSGADLKVMDLDLSQFKSVHSFADKFQQDHQQLDLLINNAGIMMPPFSKTEDGLESQMGVNYFGHFLLTGLLLPLLEKTEGSRVVQLSSIAAKSGKINFENLNSEKKYSRMGAYGQSKLACLMFAIEMQRRLEKKGSKVLSVAAHPGGSKTNLVQHMPWIIKGLMSMLMPFMGNPPANAALPTVYAAIGEDIVGADYCGPTGFREIKGKPNKVKPPKHALDEEVAAKLWEVSEQLTNCSFLS